MAIDYGTKAIGVAVSDELQLTARPLTTIRRAGRKYAETLESICSLADRYEIGLLIIGMPFNMDGTRGAAAESVERFIADLKRKTEIPITVIDERLTSYEADQILRERGVSARERKERSDEYAAMIMLQDYLDAQSRPNRELIQAPTI